jgi:hypothetical protein
MAYSRRTHLVRKRPTSFFLGKSGTLRIIGTSTAISPHPTHIAWRGQEASGVTANALESDDSLPLKDQRLETIT